MVQWWSSGGPVAVQCSMGAVSAGLVAKGEYGR